MARIPDTWYPGPGIRHRSRSDAEDRTPSTEDRARPPENAHIGFASCIPSVRVFRRQVLVPGSRSRVPAPGTRYPYRIDAEGRIPSTEDRAGKRAHRVCILDPASIRALRAIRPSPTLLRHFVTSLLRHFVTSSLRPCTFLHFFGPPSPGTTAIFCTFGTGRRNVGAFGKFPRLRMDPDTPPDWHRGCKGQK